MSEFQLTHVALVGARMPAFHPYGFHARSELAMCRVNPDITGPSLQGLPTHQLQAGLRAHLPIWVHNIISDPNFPGREKLALPLRRFEGELHDNKDDEVVAAVLSAGFRDQNLDPLNLPERLPMRQRCTMVMQVGVWQEAYQRLEEDLVSSLAACAPEIDSWLDSIRAPQDAVVG